MNLAMGPHVPRILLVMKGSINEQTVRECSAGALLDDVPLAVCYQLPNGADGLHEGLSAQRSLTELLRQVHGARAEAIAIFVASERDGQRVEDCADAWGATEVRA